jgi:hypothetical protein
MKFWNHVRAIELIGLVVLTCLLIGCKDPLTPAQFIQAVEVCRWSGGIPKPIYPSGDPLRVTHVECEK